MSKLEKYVFTDIKGIQRTISINDKVVYIDGTTGKIVDICDCELCKERGFYEFEVELDEVDNGFINGNVDFITKYDFINNFKRIVSIGNEKFNDKNLVEELRHKINDLSYNLLDYCDKIEQENKILEKALECALKQLYPEPFYHYDESYKKAYIEDKASLLEIEKENK